MKSLSTSILILSGLSLGLAQSAHAHVSYNNIPLDGSSIGSYTNTLASYKADGWIAGTTPELGNSHLIGGLSARWFKLTLTHSALVDMSFIQNTKGLDPAFTVYKGAFPLQAHDDTEVDPLNPVDETTFFAAISPTDHAPGDPNIPHYLPNSDASALVANPAWTQTFSGSGGLTAEQWYTANYTPHNGYRDTLNGTLNGGIDTNPASSNFGGLLNPYVGQFDAFGNWSMANQAGQASTVQYLTSVSGTSESNPGLGKNWGGNGNHDTAVGTGESLLGYFMAAGVYTIAASGEACNNTTTACVSPNYSATFSLSVHPVPLPAAVWLFGSALGGLGLMRRKVAKSA